MNVLKIIYVYIPSAGISAGRQNEKCVNVTVKYRSTFHSQAIL